jgi:hypothetical protein
MKRFALLLCLAVLCFLSPVRAQVNLSFDDVVPGPLSTQYQARGATFNLPLVRDYAQMPGFAHSGTHAIELCFAIEFCKSTLNVSFTAGQARVKVFVGFTSQMGQASPVRMRALDQNDAVVTEATVTLGPSSAAIPIQVPLEVTSSSANIRQVVVGFASPDAFNNGLAFDDLEFATQGPPPVCTIQQDPVVSLAQPQSGTGVQINEFLLQGSVTTAGPLDLATLTVAAPGNTRVSNLLGPFVQPNGGPFGATRVDEALFAGTNTITVTAHNCHGSGSASTTVTYTPVPDGTTVKLLRMEITQATQDANNSVPLIAGKPTVVRLYFATTGSPATINGVRGDITGYREGGNLPLLAQSIGSTTIDASQNVNAKRLDLSKSVNFNLSPDFFAQGLMHFWVVRLYVSGPGGTTLTCDGCAQWNAQFRPARPFNLVVVPFFYQFSNKTADAGASLLGALGWFNNVYPLSGNFPSDPAGVNFTLLPLQSTELILPRDDDRFMFRLQQTLDFLLSQGNVPPDTKILGVIPAGSGGLATGGNAAFGDSRAVEDLPGPASDPENYGAIWAQEIGHDFGRRHVSTSHGEMPPTDPNFPYQHGGIGEPGLGIGTEGWNGFPFVVNPGTPASGSKHAHDFMSYGMPNDPADHTFSWVSPYTYQGLMSAFQPQAQALAPPAPPADKLIVNGTIGANGRATLYPFYLVKTSHARGSGASGNYSIVLLDAGGETLATYRFTPHQVSRSPSLSFNEFVPWDAGTKRILVRRDAATIAERPVSANKPILRVTGPGSGDTWGPKATITWQASDADNDPLTYTVLYNSGLDDRWIPIAADVTEQSVTVDTTLLAGSPRARIRVRVTDGVNTTEADSAGFFTVPENPPLVAILGAADGQVIPPSGARFSAAAYDPKDGLLPPAKLQWISDRDGSLGYSGQLVVARPLSRGTHVITLTATNSQGQSASTRINVVVR